MVNVGSTIHSGLAIGVWRLTGLRTDSKGTHNPALSGTFQANTAFN